MERCAQNESVMKRPPNELSHNSAQMKTSYTFILHPPNYEIIPGPKAQDNQHQYQQLIFPLATMSWCRLAILAEPSRAQRTQGCQVFWSLFSWGIVLSDRSWQHDPCRFSWWSLPEASDWQLRRNQGPNLCAWCLAVVCFLGICIDAWTKKLCNYLTFLKIPGLDLYLFSILNLETSMSPYSMLDTPHWSHFGRDAELCGDQVLKVLVRKRSYSWFWQRLLLEWGLIFDDPKRSESPCMSDKESNHLRWIQSFKDNNSNLDCLVLLQSQAGIVAFEKPFWKPKCILKNRVVGVARALCRGGGWEKSGVHQTLQGFVIHRNGHQMPLPLWWRLLWKETTWVVGTRGPLLGRPHNFRLPCSVNSNVWVWSLEKTSETACKAFVSPLQIRVAVAWNENRLGTATPHARLWRMNLSSNTYLPRWAGGALTMKDVKCAR